jgi:hypothetical protein
MNSATTWFARAVWTGVIVNYALAVPTLVAPDRMLALFGLEPATPALWPRFSAWLLMLLSLFYIPGAVNPFHYKANAWLSVVSRFAGVTFFLTQARQYWLFAGVDFVFGLLAAIFLIGAYRQQGS